jgi:adenylate cyclase
MSKKTQSSFRVPITISVFSIIVAVAITLAASIITYAHSNHQEQALVVAKDLMTRSAESVQLRVAILINPIESIAKLSPGWPEIGERPTSLGHPSHSRILALLRDRPEISSIYLAYEDGDFYLVGRAATRPKERLRKLGAPDETVFLEQVILRGDQSAQLIRRFLDDQGTEISSVTVDQAAYDPRTRPWYESAQAMEGTARTDVYLFAGTGKPGLTMSRRHDSGVVGVDMTLHQLATFLDKEPQAKHGVLAVLRADGEVLAQSSPDDTASGGIGSRDGQTSGRQGAVLEMLAQKRPDGAGSLTSTIEIEGESWLAYVASIPFGGNTKEFLDTLIVSILIIAASVPLIWVVSRSVARPLIALADMADRLGKFDLSGEVSANSFVDEVRTLQGAMARMKTSLNTFGIYVPKALVKQLIERDEVPNLGGERRKITILFTDLENFTAMSAELSPEEVMRRMSQYFEAVTQTLIHHGATIDKYIGDAVMAFWNAPDDTSDHVRRACEAALELVEVAREETAAWSDPNLPPIRTRVGIHCGEAIVGNVGSSDRMNYTALGATVNLASRLETLNRDHGSDILVSQAVADEIAGAFETRGVGKVSLKGFEQPVNVFELVGATKI